MHISDIVRAFIESDIDDWTRIDQAANSIHARPYWETGAEGSRSAWTTFSSYAVLNSQPDVQIVWGLDEDESPFAGRERSPRSFPELPKWPDPEVRMQNAMILWHGMPVHHFYYLIVDGGRGIIPVPDVKAEEPRMGARFKAYFLRDEFEKVRQLAFLDARNSSSRYLDEATRAVPVVQFADEVTFDDEDTPAQE